MDDDVFVIILLGEVVVVRVFLSLVLNSVWFFDYYSVVIGLCIVLLNSVLKVNFLFVELVVYD